MDNEKLIMNNQQCSPNMSNGFSIQFAARTTRAKSLELTTGITKNSSKGHFE